MSWLCGKKSLLFFQTPVLFMNPDEMCMLRKNSPPAKITREISGIP
jgi:hypothetical protein